MDNPGDARDCAGSRAHRIRPLSHVLPSPVDWVVCFLKAGGCAFSWRWRRRKSNGNRWVWNPRARTQEDAASHYGRDAFCLPRVGDANCQFRKNHHGGRQQPARKPGGGNQGGRRQGRRQAVRGPRAAAGGQRLQEHFGPGLNNTPQNLKQPLKHHLNKP